MPLVAASLYFVQLGDREWLNPETGKPWPYFIEALIQNFQNEKGNANKPRFAAAEEAARVLERPKKAALLWTELKRQILFYRERWERDKALGILTPYLPPHFSDRPEPSLKEAAKAMEEMTGNQQLLPAADASPAKEEVAATRPSLYEWQEKLNSRQFGPTAKFLAQINPQWGYRIDEELNLILPAEEAPSFEYLQWLLGNALTASKARRLIEQNPDWGFYFDETGELRDF